MVGVTGSIPVVPTSLRSLRELRLGRPSSIQRSEASEGRAGALAKADRCPPPRCNRNLAPRLYMSEAPSVGGLCHDETFKAGDHVSWNSEAGRVRGRIVRVHERDVNYKGYVHHASPDDPQYEIKSDKTDHVALHKGPALRLLRR
jgi:Hypervirulence associated proteins TUDOR domain